MHHGERKALDTPVKGTILMRTHLYGGVTRFLTFVTGQLRLIIKVLTVRSVEDTTTLA